MRRFALAALAAAGLLAAGAPGAVAADGPCAQQRALFEKHNIQVDMYAPLVGVAYGEICSRTG